MAAADKMFAILDAPEPKRGSRVIEADRISFACRGVGYSYDGERTVLSDVDFDAAAGSFTGIVGESGSGKSTLAGILSGRNAGFAGSVEVGGVPIQEASRASLASTVTVVPFSSYPVSYTHLDVYKRQHAHGGFRAGPGRCGFRATPRWGQGKRVRFPC